MRILILCLVLANLGFLAWVSWVAPRPAPPPRYEGPGITLLRELEPEAARLAGPAPAILDDDLPGSAGDSDSADGGSADGDSADGGSAEGEVENGGAAAAPDSAVAGLPDEAAAASLAEAAPAAGRCLAVGPFITAEAVDTAVATFVGAGFAPVPVASEDEVWDGYWVFIEQIESRAEANGILDELAADGIEDAYMIPNSDSGILISLGVFSEISRAGTQASRVGDLGFEATISERTRTAATTWLEIEADGETDPLGLLQAPGRISRLEQRGCQGPAAD